jgi:hypothetical protein
MLELANHESRRYLASYASSILDWFGFVTSYL